MSRRFHLMRYEDVSGVSGTGVVAEGVVFASGRVVMEWLSRYKSVAIYNSLEELEAIHSHGGRTCVVFIDEPAMESVENAG